MTNVNACAAMVALNGLNLNFCFLTGVESVSGKTSSVPLIPSVSALYVKLLSTKLILYKTVVINNYHVCKHKASKNLTTPI